MEGHSYSWIGRLNVVNVEFGTIIIKTPADFFAEIDRLILKLIWKCKGPRITKKILKKKNKVEDSHFPVSKLTTKPQ